MLSPHPRTLRFTLLFIALVQLALGLAFLLAPEQAAASLGLSTAPGWAHWLLGMMAARCLAMAYGMALAARQPVPHLAWLRAMVGVQLIDWGVTLKYLTAGAVTLAQVSTAPFLPLVFVALLAWSWPRPARVA